MKLYPENYTMLGENIDFKPCIKKPIVVHATQVSHPFQVETLEGNYKIGKSGDYLMCGIRGELYICDKDIFEESYNWQLKQNKNKE